MAEKLEKIRELKDLNHSKYDRIRELEAIVENMEEAEKKKRE